MGSQAQLDLAAVDPAIWCVKSGDTVYGPYTLGQITAFISENRIVRRTLISDDGGTHFQAAERIAALVTALACAPTPKRREADAGPGNFIVVTQLEGESEHGVTAVLNSVGRFAEATNGIYILRSTLRLAKIREKLAAVTGSHDRFIIVDASRNRIAWLNHGPETDVHLRSVWDKDLEGA